MTSEAIHRVYSLHKQGLSNKAIADRLNKDFLATPTGRGSWHAPGVARAIRYADAERIIVEERRKGTSYSAIARRLNEEGFPTTQGGKAWYPGTVRLIWLRHE